MAEREERPKQPQDAPAREQSAPAEKLPPAENQDAPLKVHGDKLEQRKG